MPRDQVLISYSHRDARWRDELEIHLKPYHRTGSITSWSDKQIAPGSEWFREIQSALANSKVAVLLVSPDFIASDFIYEHELGPLLKDAKQGGVRILWVPVRASSYEKTLLRDYQALHDPEKPLYRMADADRDAAWVKICQKIERSCQAIDKELKAEKPVGSEDPKPLVPQKLEEPEGVKQRFRASLVFGSVGCLVFAVFFLIALPLGLFQSVRPPVAAVTPSPATQRAVSPLVSSTPKPVTQSATPSQAEKLLHDQQQSPAIAVRSYNAEVDVVVQGANNSLHYYWATPGSQWQEYTIAGNGTTFSSPAIAVRSYNAEVDVVVQGPNNSLRYYWATPPNYQWQEYTIAGNGTTFSSPAIAVRSDNGEADVVVQGANNSLHYYWATPGSQWHEYTIAGPGSRFVGPNYGSDSSPAIAVRSTGEADVVAVAKQSLSYYWAFPGSVWQVANLGSLETPQ